jgi:hypothetical protein
MIGSFILVALTWWVGWPAALPYVASVAVSARDAYLIVTREHGILG